MSEETTAVTRPVKERREGLVELTPAKLLQLRETCHVCVPVTAPSDRAVPYFAPIFTALYIDAREEAGQVWPLPGGGGKLGLSKVGVTRLAIASGIQMKEAKVEERSDSYIRVKAWIRQRNASGEWIEYSAQQELDKGDLYADELAIKLKKNSPEAAAKLAEAAVQKIWRHRLARAETGAYLRAMRFVLVLKSGFTPAELARPFICQDVQFRPDPNDPAIQGQLRAAGDYLIQRMYGGEGSASGAAAFAIEGQVGDAIREEARLQANVERLCAPDGTDRVAYAEYKAKRLAQLRAGDETTGEEPEEWEGL